MDFRWLQRPHGGLGRVIIVESQVVEVSYLAANGQWVAESLRALDDPDSGYQQAVPITEAQAQAIAPACVNAGLAPGLRDPSWKPPWVST